MILNGHLGHEHCPDYPDDRLEEAKEPGAEVPLREGLPAILFFTSETQTYLTQEEGYRFFLILT